MKEQLTKALNSIKEFWQKLTPKVKKIIKFSAAALALLVIVLTTLFYINDSQFTEIFAGMEKAEATEVYAALQEEGYQVQMDNQGRVLVPSKDYDSALFAMAEAGFPKSTLSYDTFLNMDLTKTEYEKKEAKRITLEKNLTNTLEKAVQGIRQAVVLLNLPEESTHVWDQSVISEGSASVTVTMENGVELTPERVTGIKNLVAAGVPSMKAENVEVINGATGALMEGISDGSAGSVFNTERFQYERRYERSLEDKINRLLVPQYGIDNVVAVVTVQFDYDKMIEESMEYNPDKFTYPEDKGKGIINHQQTQQSQNGTGAASGLAGEETNTDTAPNYGAQDGTGTGGSSDFSQVTDYAISYIKQQIEKGEPAIKDISVAVKLNDRTLDQNQTLIQSLQDQVAKATLIPAGAISVTGFTPNSIGTGTDIEDPNTAGGFQWQNIYFLYIGIPLLLVAIVLVVLFLLRKRRKAKETAAQQESEQMINSLQEEIEERKKQLAEAAQKDGNPGDGAIVNEVRDFAKENPEITANLIRSWLKEDS